MEIVISLKEKKYRTRTNDGICISIPVNFNGPQPNTYDVDIATSRAYEAGSFVGDTRRGGGCNFEEIKMIPHCNGTHTECVGHISYERINVNQFVNDLLIPSTLITVQPVSAAETSESYVPKLNAEDRLITASAIEECIKSASEDFMRGLIIRTLPNDETKLSRRYSSDHPPFFSIEAIKLIDSLGIDHLLTDLPSIDRTFDEGKLSCHHIFWNVVQGSHHVDPANCSRRTITEMIYVPDKVSDRHYLMSIQIPDMSSDAAPSRIILLSVEQIQRVADR